MSQHAASKAPEDKRAVVAVDLGAESCRVSLLRWQGDMPEITLVHRFPNGPVEDDGLRWPLATIEAGIDDGLRRAAELAPEGIRSIAVDGWAVDYVRVDADNRPLAAPFCYRDERTIAAQDELHTKISPGRLHAIAGIQLARLNTLYQLYADGSPVYDTLTQEPVQASPPSQADSFVWNAGGQPIASVSQDQDTLYTLSVEGQEAQPLGTSRVSGVYPGY